MVSSDSAGVFQKVLRKFAFKADVDDMERFKGLTAFSPVFNTITQGADVDIQVEEKWTHSSAANLDSRLCPGVMVWPLIRFDSAEAQCLLEGYMPVTKLFAQC